MKQKSVYVLHVLTLNTILSGEGIYTASWHMT